MNRFSDVFDISAKNNLRESRKRFNNGKKCYDSLSNKDSEYCIAVKKLMDTHKMVVDIWENAISQDKEKPLDTSEQRL